MMARGWDALHLSCLSEITKEVLVVNALDAGGDAPGELLGELSSTLIRWDIARWETSVPAKSLPTPPEGN